MCGSGSGGPQEQWSTASSVSLFIALCVLCQHWAACVVFGVCQRCHGKQQNSVCACFVFREWARHWCFSKVATDLHTYTPTTPQTSDPDPLPPAPPRCPAGRTPHQQQASCWPLQHHEPSFSAPSPRALSCAACALNLHPPVCPVPPAHPERRAVRLLAHQDHHAEISRLLASTKISMQAATAAAVSQHTTPTLTLHVLLRVALTHNH